MHTHKEVITDQSVHCFHVYYDIVYFFIKRIRDEPVRPITVKWLVLLRTALNHNCRGDTS